MKNKGSKGWFLARHYAAVERMARILFLRTEPKPRPALPVDWKATIAEAPARELVPEKNAELRAASKQFHAPKL
jgi:hypothetical protein